MKKIEMIITTAKGTELLLEAKINSEIRESEIDMDGFVFKGDLKLYESSDYTIKKDDKVVARGDLKNTVNWPRETTYQGYTGIVFGQVLISKESFEKIKTAYEESLTEEHSKSDVKAYIEKHDAEKKEHELNRAKSIIAAAEKQVQIPTRAELKEIQEKWNNIYNERLRRLCPSDDNKRGIRQRIKDIKRVSRSN